MSTLKDIPWKAVRKVYYAYRKRYFSVPRPDVKGIIVNMGIEQCKAFFRTNHFDYQELSYHYSGEDLNIYRADYEEGSEYPNMQLHVRCFEMKDGSTFIEVHYEPDPTEHPEVHLDESYMSWEEGRKKLRGLLANRGVQHKIQKVNNAGLKGDIK